MMASLAPTTPCAAVEIVLPMVMMELANQTLEVGSAEMTDRVAVQTPIVAVANVEAVEIVSLTLEEGSARMRT